MRAPQMALLTTALLLFGPLVAADEVYRWVDDEGVTHFSAQPPKNRQSDRMNTKTGHSDPIDYRGRFSASDPEEGEEGESDNEAPGPSAEADMREACQTARQNLQKLERGGRIAETADDGTRRYLTEEQREARMERAREAIEKTCR